MVSDRFADAGQIPANLDKALDELEHLIKHGQRQAGRTSFVNNNEIGGVAQTEGDKAYSRFAAGLAADLSKYFRYALAAFIL